MTVAANYDVFKYLDFEGVSWIVTLGNSLTYKGKMQEVGRYSLICLMSRGFMR